MIVQWIRVSGLHKSFANLVQCTKRLDEIAELARAHGNGAGRSCRSSSEKNRCTV